MTNQNRIIRNRMPVQEQTNQIPHQEMQVLETIKQRLDSEIRYVENTIECQKLNRVTVKFLQVIESRAEAKIQLLRRNQN